MSTDEDITLTLTGKLSYSGEITFAQAVQVLALLAPGASASTSIPLNGAVSAPRSPLRQEAMSPKQALEASGAKINSEKIVAFAALVHRQSGRDTFTLEDVRPLFKQARETAPGNLNRDLSAAIGNGWVAEAEDSGEYYLTGWTAALMACDPGSREVQGLVRLALAERASPPSPSQTSSLTPMCRQP
jgi:hypothetical protein